MEDLNKKTYYQYFNANPFDKKIGDCAIRAVSKGLNMPYETVCKKLKVEFENGKGLKTDDGIDLEYLQKKFNKYFDVVENFDSESYEIPEEFKKFKDIFYKDGEFDKTMLDNISVNNFITIFENTGKYLVGCMNENGVTGGHIVYVDTDDETGPKFYDTWNCGNQKVDSYMMIKDPSEWGKKPRSYSKIKKDIENMSADDILNRLNSMSKRKTVHENSSLLETFQKVILSGLK